MSENTEITSNGKTLKWSKGKAGHVCTEKELITEMHGTLFKDGGLVEEVTLINDRQQKALKILDNVEKDLIVVMKDISKIEGRKTGEGISFGWTAALIGIALAIGAFIMDLIKK